MIGRYNHMPTGTVETGKAIGKEVHVKNTGEVAGTFQISLEAPEWVLVKPVSVSLGPGEEENVYVYISPLYATEAGEYSVKIKADSQHASGDFDLRITVPEGQMPPAGNETQPPEQNATNGTGQGTNITLNVSTDDGLNETGVPITGELTAEEQEADRQFRTMAIAVIAIIIIIILAARFVLLFKK